MTANILELFFDARDNQVIRFIRWTLIVSTIILIATIDTPAFQAGAEPNIPVITIHAKRYEFKPSEITLKVGKAVRLVFISDDVTHGISVDGLGIDIAIRRYRSNEVDVTPHRAGTFEGHCSVYCGIGHDRMKLLIHVVN